MTNEKEPDLILFDIGMSEMDGYEILKAVREDYGLTSTPFILFTAFSEKNEIQKGLQLGATSYIIKPFEPDDLISLIDKCFD